jgi:hypothetical protein
MLVLRPAVRSPAGCRAWSQVVVRARTQPDRTCQLRVIRDISQHALTVAMSRPLHGD